MCAAGTMTPSLLLQRNALLFDTSFDQFCACLAILTLGDRFRNVYENALRERGATGRSSKLANPNVTYRDCLNKHGWCCFVKRFANADTCLSLPQTLPAIIFVMLFSLLSLDKTNHPPNKDSS